MKHLFSILLAVVFSLQAYADSAIFNNAGFSINVLDANVSDAISQPLAMRLPASNGFSANVNVQIQPFPGSTKDYKKMSNAQFEQMGINVITCTEKQGATYWEYAGTMQGRQLHFYAKAIKVGHLFYLATGTDLESNWSKTSKSIKAVIDSFTIIDRKK